VSTSYELYTEIVVVAFLGIDIIESVDSIWKDT